MYNTFILIHSVAIMRTGILSLNKYFEFKKLVGRRSAPELDLLLVVIVLFTPILHETLTNSNFDTNTICQLSNGSLFKYRKLKSTSQQKCFSAEKLT